MRLPRRLLSMMQVGLAVWCVLTPQSGFAYSHPLTDEDVRNGYFLGQDSERAAEFLSQYMQALPVPATGPQVAQIELRTPYAQVVWTSQQHPMGFSAQQAAADYKSRGDYILVRVQVMFTPTYTDAGEDFWRGVSVGLVQKNHLAARRVVGVPIYASDRDNDNSYVIGANVYVEFNLAGVESDSVQVEVVPPQGAAVHATFDLNRLS